MISETENKNKFVKVSLNSDAISILPYKRKSMQIFQGNKYYILDPYRYEISTLMMMLDLSKINKLGDKFAEIGEKGIKREEFIQMMKQELPTIPNDPMDELNMVYGLYKLFCEIDFNGDGHMQWQEFTQFIIDTVEGETEGKDAFGDDDLISYGKNKNESQLIKYKRYNISTYTKDYHIHKKDIIDAIFLYKLDRLFICEYGSKIIKIYNPKTGRPDELFNLDDFFKQQQAISNKKGPLKEEKKKKIAGEVKQNLTFSILSMCSSPWNVVALCLSNSKIMFFSFTSDGKGDFLYEMATPSLQKRVWYLPEHNIWLSAGMKIELDKIYYLNELDVEFEYKSSKLECNYNQDHPYRNFFCEQNGHRDEILTVIEIRKPMLVLTGCMDCKIRLINIYDKDFVKVWCFHESGVRSLDYTPNIDTAGYILSTGFEYYINIYSTDLSLDDAFKGKLEGHYAPVIMCKFLSGTQMCASVDEEGNVRIWDSKLKQCLQLIPIAKKNFKVIKMLMMPKYNRFIVYGNKMVFYDAKYRETDFATNNQPNEDNYPIQVEFNQYYMNFYVTTLKDVRVYSSIDGNLMNKFQKFRAHENFDQNTKIKSFAFEDRHRKFYLGFSNGAVHQFNAGNGSLIKAVNEFEMEKDGITSIKNHHTKEVSSLFYYFNYGEHDENFILITAGLDSLINMYSEKNPEQSLKLRTIQGGHKIGEKHCDILCMNFSFKLNLFATGSTNGLVVVWDFELSKIDEVLYVRNGGKNKIDVFSLQFLDPFPVLVATYSDGSCYFWGVKPSVKYRGECFLRSRSYHQNGTRIEPSSLNASIFIYKDMEAIPQSILQEKEHAQRPSLILPHIRKSLLDLERKDQKIESIKEALEREAEMEIETKEEIDEELDPSRYECPKTKSYLIFGDHKGWIKILDLSGIIRKYNIEKAPGAVIKSNFNILKKDDINVETILGHYIQKYKDIQLPYISFYPHVIIREFQAHDDAITSLSTIEEPFSFVTCSKDNKVKIWNFNCELIGLINTKPNFFHPDKKVDWKFKVDWEKLKQKEIEEVLGILDKVSGVESNMKDADKYLSMLKDEEEMEEKMGKHLVKIMRSDTEHKRKRFKLIENKKEKNEKEGLEQVGRPNMNNEALYLQEIVHKLNKMFKPTGPDIGISEMTKNIVDSMTGKVDFVQLINPEKDKKEQVMKVPEKKTNKNRRSVTIPPNFRDYLFSEKIIRKSDDYSLSDNLILPLINHEYKSHEKIKFRKGETEKILSYEYYQNSYNACCELKSSNNLSNEPLRQNYNAMWKFVDDYSKHIKQRYSEDTNKEEELETKIKEQL